MDMKKILQAVDGASTKKPAGGSNDMKKFMQIVEGKGPLNRLTQAESIAMQEQPKKKTITNPVLNVKEDAKPSMVGKYFKTIQEELLEAEQKHKDRAGQLAKRVIERVTIGPDGQVTGGFKPTAPDPDAPPRPAAPAEPPATLPGKDLPRAEKADRQAGTVTVAGQDYEMVWLEPGGIRPRGGQRFALPMAMMGIRGIGNYIGIIAGGRAYMLPKGEQESLQEQYTYKDIAEMARLGFSDKEIASKLGFDLTEGLKDPKDNPCWKGYKPVGTKQKGGRTVPNCVPKEDIDVDESGLQYYTGKKKYGADGMAALAAAGRKGANQQELGRIKDKYMKKDETVQKKGPAGQLKAMAKPDVKGTVLGSPEKSQKGLRNKLVGGGAS